MKTDAPGQRFQGKGIYSAHRRAEKILERCRSFKKNGLIGSDIPLEKKRGLLTFVWVYKVSLKIIMLNYQTSGDLPAPFLACPKKGGAKEGHPVTILIRLARSSSVHFRNSGFALRQSEMFNPRTRSHDGNVRKGRRSRALTEYYPHKTRKIQKKKAFTCHGEGFLCVRACGERDYFFIASATLPTILADGLSVMSPIFFHWAGQASTGFAAR